MTASCSAEDAPVLVRQVNAVRQDAVRSDDAEVVEVRHRCAPGLRQAVGVLLARFADVDVQQSAGFCGGLGRSAQARLRHRVHRVGSLGDLDAVGQVCGHLQQFGVAALAAWVRAPVRSRQVEQSDGSAHPHFFGGPHRGRLVPVHVVEEDRARLDHLEDRDPAAGIDVLVGELGLGGPDVVG